ncbi:MAG: siphovirus Gp157 family protein [Saccharofermentans sp.]|nr:siphovirus Gp157 family protein [Saccharofermentans sp.]
MANIYELTGSFQTLWNLMEEGVLEDSVLEEVFENTTEELAIKLEGYCKFIKNLESDIAGLKEEEKRLSARRKTMENTVERAKEAMKVAMNTAGEKKLPCGTFTVSVQSNPPSCVIDCELAGIPSKYLIPQEPKIDRKALLEDLKSEDNILKGVAHIEQGESLRIR